ncbi:MAG: peptidylprolyl isomerase [Paracoccaceae bacterium]
MLKSILTGASALAILAMAAPAWAQESATETTSEATVPVYDNADANSVLARVNGAEITLGHVIALRQSLPDDYQNMPDETLLNGIIEQMIEQSLLSGPADGAVPLGIRLTTENEIRAQMAARQIDALLAALVTDEELQALYDAEIAGIEPQLEYSASHILVETEDEANAIIAELDAGADFAAIAQEKSLDPGSGAAGGSLGWFGLGRMVPEFEAAVVALETGQTSAPVQSQFGWHIVRLDDQRNRPLPTVDDLRAELTQEVNRRKVLAEIDRLRGDADIETGLLNIDPALSRNYDLIAE